MNQTIKTALLGLLVLGATQLQAATPAFIHNDSKGQWVLQSTEAVQGRSTVTYTAGGRITRTATFGALGGEPKDSLITGPCTIHLFPGDMAVVTNAGEEELTFTLYDQYGCRVPEIRDEEELAWIAEHSAGAGAGDLRLQIVGSVQLPEGGQEHQAAWVVQNRSAQVCIGGTEGIDTFTGKKMTIFRDQF